MTQSLPELTVMLKKLRLSGMYDCLEARNKEALSNQMSYLEFLTLLTQDELLARSHRQYERRYKQACLRGNKTLENFDFSFNSMINQTLVRDLATCRFIKEKSPVLIIGPCGTGKSHIAQALAHCAIQKEYNVLCTSQARLSEALQEGRATNSYAKKLKSLAKVDLLVIDDFGIRPLRSPEDEDLHEVVAERYELKSTILTSNLSLEEWGAAFPNQLLGIATLDRLRHNAYQLILDGKSFRSPRPTDEAGNGERKNTRNELNLKEISKAKCHEKMVTPTPETAA